MINSDRKTSVSKNTKILKFWMWYIALTTIYIKLLYDIHTEDDLQRVMFFLKIVTDEYNLITSPHNKNIESYFCGYIYKAITTQKTFFIV